MPFCYSPWTNIDIAPSGTMSPCCKFQHDQYPDSALNINNALVGEYLNSPTIIKIKQEFEQGQWPSGCERCRIEEDNQIESKRQLDYTRWEESYQNYNVGSNQFITASIAFGNTCNLKCITCDPRSSSRWQKEYSSIYKIDIKPTHFNKINFATDLFEHAPNLIHLDIPGGEPFLSGVQQQFDLLKRYIDKGQASTISLHYTTNTTIYPDSNWWDLWENFREIDIQISIDGVGPRQEYIRYPSNWNQVVDNVKQYQAALTCNKNLKLSLSHTVSSYNIYYLDEFFTWCKSMNLPRPWLGRVHSPAEMRPSIWPPHIKKHIVNHLLTSTNEDVRTWATLVNNSDDSCYYNKFISNLRKHDRYRGLDFDNTFPEIAKFL